MSLNLHRDEIYEKRLQSHQGDAAFYDAAEQFHRAAARYELVTFCWHHEVRPAALRATKYREPGFPEPGRPVDLFARSVERGTRRDARTLSRPVYTSAHRTAEHCIAICTPVPLYTCNCVRVCVCVCASGDYVATLLFQRRLATRNDSVTEGNEIRSDETLTRRTTCRTVHTHARARAHTSTYISTFLFPWRIGARYPTPKRE